MDTSTTPERVGRTVNIGPIHINMPSAPMRKGDIVYGHRHNFDHPTLAWAGGFRVNTLKVDKVNAFGYPLDAKVIRSVDIWRHGRNPFTLILKGEWHELISLEDDSQYMCIYPHRKPQAISLDVPGQLPQPPYFKRDEKGVLWQWVDENIVERTVDWADATR
jgi:hypothetical protein